MVDQAFPQGWDEKKVKDVIAYYEQQTDEEAVAEDEAAARSSESAMMEIPIDLVPQVRDLLAKSKN